MKEEACSGYKKGNAAIDLAVVLLLIVVFGIIAITSGYVLKTVNQDIQADEGMSIEAKDIIQDNTDRYSSTFDHLFLAIFFLLWILTLVASYFIDSHPLFFAVSLILLIFVFYGAIHIGNLFEEYTSDAEINEEASLYPITNWILTHLLTVAIIMGSSILLVLYGKMQGGL